MKTALIVIAVLACVALAQVYIRIFAKNCIFSIFDFKKILHSHFTGIPRGEW